VKLAHAIVSILLFSHTLYGSTIPAVYIKTPPKIDGKIEETIWQTAAIVTDLIQKEPNTGESISEKTIVYTCYDKDNLYVAFNCFDDPQKITAKEIGRDATLKSEDKITITIDTFLDRRNGYWFEISPRGSKGDALFGQNGAVRNKDWDGIWRGRSVIHDKGWSTEIAIPFKSLNFHPTQSTWGIKFSRDIQHKSEIAFWPASSLNGPKYQVADAAELVGLKGMSQGLGLDIRPYALGGIDQERDASNKWDGDAGLDLFYQITPALKSVFTVNTDFAQTEVDDRKVNLTRFRLYFPEKRDFFLDGSNYFQFANIGNSTRPKLQPFFSRRIGLDDNGTPIPIIAGTKITGQAGKWNLGFMDVVDQRENRDQNFAVARITRNIGEQSAIGVIGTHGNADSKKDNYVIGADLKLATSKLGGDKNLNYYLYGLKSNTKDVSDKDIAIGTEISYPNDFLNFTAGFMQIDENFDAGIGYVRRKNIRNSYGTIGLGPRPKKWGIVQLDIENEFEYITDLDNRLITRDIGFQPLGIRFISGEEVSFEFNQQYDILDKDFDIYDDYIVPADTYEYWRQKLEFSSAQRRDLWTELEYEWGDFWTGNADQIALSAGYKIAVPVNLVMEYEHNDVKLPVGDFTVDVYRVNLDLLFSPRLTLKSFVQYDDESRRMGWQSRLQWIITPGNEILFAWNSIWSDPMDRMNPHLRDLTLAQSTTRLKINYNYRF
jgi:hypothetical protein